MSLTDKALRAIRPTGKVFEISDGHGLGVRVSATGRIVFQFRYRYHGRPQRMDLGTYPLMSLAHAREAHHEARKLLDQDIDPAKRRALESRHAADAQTVEQLADQFIKRQLRRDRKCPEEAERILRKDIIPRLGELKIDEVTRRDVVRAIEAIVDRGAPVMANRATSIVKQMFKFGLVQGYLESSPCEQLTRTSIGGAEKPRDLYLSYREIWRLWHGLELEGFGEALKIGVKLLLATGQRRGELMMGQWSHVNLDRKLWIIPAELSKNGKPHLVQLSPLGISLFSELKTYAADSAYFLPSPGANEDRPMGIYAMNTALQRCRQGLGMPKLSPHVLRHTFATHAGGIGVAPHVVEKLLNHTLSGMVAVYNHQPYYAEREAAMEKWAERLLEIVGAKSEKDVVAEPGRFGQQGAAPTHEESNA